MAKGLGLPMERVYVNVDRYGNTSAASVPIALAEAVGRAGPAGRPWCSWRSAPATRAARSPSSGPPTPRRRPAAAVRPEESGPLPDWDGRSVRVAVAARFAAGPASRPCPIGHSAPDATWRRQTGPTGRRAGSHRHVGPSPRPGHSDGGVRMIDLSGKSAIVTGGARGIGRAIVLRLARQGADIAFLDRGPVEAAEATRGDVEALGRRCFWVEGDVTDPEAPPRSSRARSRRSAGSTSWSTTPASPATT